MWAAAAQGLTNIPRLNASTGFPLPPRKSFDSDSDAYSFENKRGFQWHMFFYSVVKTLQFSFHSKIGRTLLYILFY